MSGLPPRAPPLSPVLLAGIALRPLPLPPLGVLGNMAMSVIRRRHPDVFERLAALGDASFLVDPVDLPFHFVLRLAGASPSLRVARAGDHVGEPTAIIRGPLLALLEILQGRLDGDAAFFARELEIEGDMEAVVALRNAVDSGEIDVVDDLLSFLGPLNEPVSRALAAARAMFARAAHDLEILRAAVVAPVARRCDLQGAELRRLEGKVADVHRQMRRTKPADRRAAGLGAHET